MLRLIFIRHGKSDWNAGYSGDHERPLNKRGRKAARAMGVFLERSGNRPHAILSSTAVRARTTVELAAEAGGWEVAPRLTRRLYGTSAATVIEEIQKEDDQAQVLLVAGHQPTWSETCSRLMGGGEMRYPTAAACCLSFPCGNWSAVRPGGGQLLWFVPPKLIQGLLEP
ncbi:MAG TPA: histidine phosphatase family protein [Acidobacteriota bacterium]|nr:histidine phosphatase family protein [Acidobacteriota bacterium]